MSQETESKGLSSLFSQVWDAAPRTLAQEFSFPGGSRVAARRPALRGSPPGTRPPGGQAREPWKELWRECVNLEDGSKGATPLHREVQTRGKRQSDGHAEGEV